MATRSFVTFLTVLAALLATVWTHPQGRILDGENGVKGQFPHAVSVRLDNAHICGGAILSMNHILTAAHCVTSDDGPYEADRISVKAGSISKLTGGSNVMVKTITVHPEYNDIVHDLAILELQRSLTESTTIGSIQIASSEDPEPEVGSLLQVCGWGENSEGTSSFTIQRAAYPLSDEATCLDAYSGHDASTFCLDHEPKRGLCFGDGGNGAVYEGKLLGISSFIVGACGSRYPDVFVNVPAYSSWIQEVIQS